MHQNQWHEGGPFGQLLSSRKNSTRLGTKTTKPKPLSVPLTAMFSEMFCTKNNTHVNPLSQLSTILFLPTYSIKRAIHKP